MLGRSELIFIVFVILVVFWPFFARRAGVKRKPKRKMPSFLKFKKSKDQEPPNAITVDYEELE